MECLTEYLGVLCVYPVYMVACHDQVRTMLRVDQNIDLPGPVFWSVSGLMFINTLAQALL